MAPVTTSKSAKPACRRSRSSSKSLETTQRTRYPRLCRGKFPVKYVETSEPATRMKKSIRTCRKLTERRKSLIRVNRLSKHSISEGQVESQHKRMPLLIPIHAILENQFDRRYKPMPRLIPLPTSAGANSREVLPNIPHTDTVGLPAVSEEVREQRVPMEISSEINPLLSGHPPKKKSGNKSKTKDTSAVLSPFERRSPVSYNTAAVLRVQQLEIFFKRLFESIDNIKASVFSPETLRFEGLCYAADLM
ncbi:unnamed protein product [Orchesella dallaii]|uniref:Uncharacterized protein n=1 Tax=Orchesella dallaii TaxID=48710 RepID=A0ABP1QKT3_9HEXA